jgi:hypothetical protein
MTRQILFKVICKDRECVIYDNGATEGFGDDVAILNYHPQLVKLAVAQALGGNRNCCHLGSAETSSDKDVPGGAGHSVPA